MTYYPVSTPYSIFTDDDGTPLENGFIYIGKKNQNPITKPLNVYFDPEGIYPAAQPIRTIGGYPSNNGTPSNIYIDSVDDQSYSILVKDKHWRQVYYNRDGLLAKYGTPGDVDNLSELRLVSNFNFPVYVRSHTTIGDGGQGTFEWMDGLAPGSYVDNNGTIILPTSGDGSGAWIRQFSDYVNVLWFGAKGDGITDDTTSIQSAINTNNVKEVHIPPGDYYCASTIYLKVGVSLIGSQKSLAATAPYSRLNGPGGSSTILKYSGTFGSEAQISLNIKGIQFANCQHAIHLLGAAYYKIEDCNFSYVRGSISHAGILLDNAILGEITGCKFFYCATGIRADNGINYHNTIKDNDFVIDDGYPSYSYKSSGITIRCNATNTGFGPLNINNNNFIKGPSAGSNEANGIIIAARGNVLNVRGNTFEGLTGNDFTITEIDPIDSSDRTSDSDGMYVRGGMFSGNWHIDGASGSPSAYCIKLQDTYNMVFIGNRFQPQVSVTGRPVVNFDSRCRNNIWHGDNLIIYNSGYTGNGISESNATYGSNIFKENYYVNNTTDGPAISVINSGYSRHKPMSEYAPKMANFGSDDEATEWYSSTSKRKMLVMWDGSSLVHARSSIETPPLYTNPTSTVTLNGTERTLRFYIGGTVSNISGALYDGQIISCINSSSLSVTLNQTGNIRVNGGTSLTLSQDEGVSFVYWSDGPYWVQI